MFTIDPAITRITENLTQSHELPSFYSKMSELGVFHFGSLPKKKRSV